MSVHGLIAVMRTAATALTGFASVAIAPSVSALAASQLAAGPTDQTSLIDAAIADAAQRFAIPEHWIRHVIALESGGDVTAVSPKGALGLMQLKPTTYAELRATLGLSDDPFLNTNNITAGAAYLRQLYDRFGTAGMFAAYNAGPGRYQAHISQGRPLPLETRAYVRAILGRLTNQMPTMTATPAPVRPPNWREAPLFTVAVNVQAKDEKSADNLQSDSKTSAAVVPLPRSPAALTTTATSAPHPLFAVIRP